MPRSKVNPSNIYSISKRMNSLWAKIPQGRVKYKVRDLVKITTQKVKFTKRYEQTLSKEIFRIGRLFNACPNLFANCQACRIVLSKASFTIKLVKFTVSPETEFQIDKVVRTRKNGGIKQHLGKWKGYIEIFNSWVFVRYQETIMNHFTLHCRRTILVNIFRPKNS